MKFSRFVIFGLFQHAIPQKNAFFPLNSFSNKKVWFIWKKVNFFFQFFFSKSILTSCLWLQLFEFSGKKFQNWVPLCFEKVLKIKAIKGELIILKHVETADQYLPTEGGGPWGASPYWLGLRLLGEHTPHEQKKIIPWG